MDLLQNLALNVADKGFPISVYNRSYDKTEAAVERAKKEKLGDKLQGYKEVKDFVMSLQKPRKVIILVKAGAPVGETLDCETFEERFVLKISLHLLFFLSRASSTIPQPVLYTKNQIFPSDYQTKPSPN